VGGDLFPGDAAAEKIEEDDRQDQAGRYPEDVPVHGWKHLTTNLLALEISGEFL
jgi:hypothetical protein